MADMVILLAPESEPLRDCNRPRAHVPLPTKPQKKFESVECQERLEDARAAPVRAGDRLGNFPHRLARALKPQQISQ